MKRFIILTPYIFWLALTIFLVELLLFKDIIELALYLSASLAFYLFLEMKRNKKSSNNKKLTRARIITYIVSNIILGYFAGLIYLFLMPVIYFMTHPLGYMDSGFTPIESYLFIGVFIVWVLVNTIILKVHSKRGLILFLISPFSMVIIPTALVLLSRIG